MKGLDGYDDGWFVEGQLSFVTGKNAGAVATIKTDQTKGLRRIIEVWEDLRHPIDLGDIVRVSAGCDKKQSTCKNKFSNILNFRGFPQMPGDDWALSYPVRDGQNDGGSLG